MSEYTNLPKPVVQLTQTGALVAKYTSIAEAAKATGLRENTISYICNGNKGLKTAGGFRFLFTSEYDPTLPPQTYAYHFDDNRKRVLQCSIGGDVLQVFRSVKEAGESFGLSSARYKIGKCCNGKLASYKGYVWKFAEQ